MTQDLEQIRDKWINAYYLGDVSQLSAYEHSELKIIYVGEKHVESSLGRYENIEHAVKNGVWKPQKPQIHIEEYEFDREYLNCKVTLKDEDLQFIAEEHWHFEQIEQSWCLIQLKIF